MNFQKNNFKFYLAFFLCAFHLSSQAQSLDPVIGVWKTINEKTNQPSSLIKIEEVQGLLEGTVIKTFNTPGQEPLLVCALCEDERKNQPIVGMKIMKGLKKDQHGAWSGGTILDPKEGKIYKVKLSSDDGKKMEVRGFIGISLIGRTQVWNRAE